jgi:acyl-[acyl-carrier-protein]-phospholipid O-acyltransferase/long-chain-fatty-acid--[acyl-carrier-protein] ligase
MRRCEKEQFATLDLVVVGAEKMPLDLAEEFQQKFGFTPSEGYGTTELSPVAAVNIPDHRSLDVNQKGTKLGTVGRPIPGCAAKVVDPDTFRDLGNNHEGLLLIKGPNVMKGYLDEPEKTAEVVKDGWYVTGDFGLIDDEGFVAITGRQSRFSKIGGEMVPHLRIEEELMRIVETPGSDDPTLKVAVTSVPDPGRGEKLVILHRPLSKTPSQIIKELSDTGLPNLWLPSKDAFYEVEQIPIRQARPAGDEGRRAAVDELGHTEIGSPPGFGDVAMPRIKRIHRDGPARISAVGQWRCRNSGFLSV